MDGDVDDEARYVLPLTLTRLLGTTQQPSGAVGWRLCDSGLGG